MLFPMINVLHFYSSISWSMCTVPRNSRFIVHWCLLSMYVSQVFSEWFSDGSSCPYYYWYLFCFYTPHALFFYYISVFSNLFAIFLHRISVPSHCTINIHVPFIFITDYDVRFVVRDGFVSLRLFGYPNFMTCFYWLCCMIIAVFL